MDQNKNPHFQPSKKKSTKRPPSNFVEALKSIGGSTAKSIKNDLLKPAPSEAAKSLFGNYNNQDQQPHVPQSPDQMPDWLREREEEMRRQEKARQRHRELVQAQPLFDRRQEEVKAQIKALRDELQLLAKDMSNLSSSVQKAIDEEVVNPGTYHVSYFEKLKTFIAQLRKQVAESRNWLDVSSQRKAAKNKYWGNVKKSGTKFMLSQERYMVTQTG